jgi:hypothetical protein
VKGHWGGDEGTGGLLAGGLLPSGQRFRRETGREPAPKG